MTINTRKAEKGQQTSPKFLGEIAPLIKLGAAPVRVAERGKNAIEAGWNNAPRRDLETFKAALRPGENIGIRLGEPSKTSLGYLHAIDFDCRDTAALDEATAKLDMLFPKCNRKYVVNTGSGTGQHFLFFAPEPLASHKLSGGDGWEIALKGTGTYIVAAGSVHPSGGRYEWAEGHRFCAAMASLIAPPEVDLSLLRKTEAPAPRQPHDPMTLPKLEQHLAVIDPTFLTYDEWCDIGMALHYEGEGTEHYLSAFDRFSQRDPERYEGFRKISQKWRSFGKQKGSSITGATIVHMANQKRTAGLVADLMIETEDLSSPPLDAPTSNSASSAASSDHFADIELTEDGVARAFAMKHDGRLRYCHTRGCWHVWTGTHWKPEGSNLAFDWSRVMCRKVGLTKPEAKSAARALARASAANGVERFARADRTFAVTADCWDRSPWLIGTPGGTVDLRTGELHKASQSDGITKLAGAAPIPLETFDPASDCPCWMGFLKHATGGDAGVTRFLAQWAGYNLTGDTSEEALVFVHGPGGSGKSTWVNTLAAILGDYGTAVASETLTKRKHDAHPEEIARLQGVRMAYSSETEAGRSWAENRIKALTGGDMMTGRFMRQDTFEFKPQLKLTIVGNNRPSFDNLDGALRRRFNVLAFDRVPAEPDHGLKAALQRELPGILSWAISGCLDWQRHGLLRPDSMVRETDAYFAAEDVIGQWMEDRCIIGPDEIGKSSAMLADLNVYLRAIGRPARTANNFAEEMERRGYKKRRLGQVMVWDRIRSRDISDDV